MKLNFFINIFIFFTLEISLTLSLIPEEQINLLTSKLTKKITSENINQDFIKDSLTEDEEAQTIIYDPKKIAKIIEDLGAPEKYDFFESTGCKKVVKDQQACGCCWSMAATTSLSYRYFLHGIDVNLSPQDGLSCYLRDCDAGNYLIDPELNLIKNGSVTEGCLPFSSGDGESMEPCPTSCKDKTEFKKYYAKEAFMTEDFYSEENFYDIVTIMIYQLIKKGPIVTGIQIFEDFMYWSDYDHKEKCKNEIYSYDGESIYEGGHAVTIAGYGKIGEKYYWLVQNSWGTETCDNGFIKIEMGQIGIENVAFEEPYIRKESPELIDVFVELNSVDEECNLIVNTSQIVSDWRDVLEIKFNSLSEKKRDFTYQCSMIELPNGSYPFCFYENYNFDYMNKGEYLFSNFGSLGVENIFTLDDSFSDFSFNYYGNNYLYYLSSQISFVSGQGSSIVLYHDYYYGIETNLPQIFANENSTKPLSDCTPYDFDGFTVVYCKIKENELEYFETNTESSPLVFKILCGYKESAEQIVMKLDKSLYPVYYVRKLFVPKNGVINYDTSLTLKVDIEGNVKDVENNFFYIFANVEWKKRNETYFIVCETLIPKKIEKDYSMICYLDIEEDDNIKFDKIYLTQIYFPYDIFSPFDIIIPKEITGEKQSDPTPEPSYSIIISPSLFLFLIVVLLI